MSGPSLLKLKVCTWHSSPQGCNKGNDCGYAHGEHELRQPRRQEQGGSAPSASQAPVDPPVHQAPVLRAEERAQRDQRHHEVFRKHNKDRTDVSFFLCHFTKSTPPVHLQTTQTGFAHERFEAILTGKEVYACALPHLGSPVRAVCFTEMMLPSLSMHAENYSPWGIAFHKSFLFNCKTANPVLYCRSELFESLKERANGDPDQLRYMTPFYPKYWDQNGQEENKTLDYSHEREWRTPGPVSFDLENLAYVFVPDLHLFKKLMPVLHTELCNKCVEIKVLEKVVDTSKKSCNNGYWCSHGSKCGYSHSRDEEFYFKFREMQASGRRGPEEESWRPSP
mmetsp:Transcript_18213/g.54749  ORF Transcript_18213/g.54749 Transcript_18213/m.54749 type:complete len:337 (-) Transcript_18213:124-1134(-)